MNAARTPSRIAMFYLFFAAWPATPAQLTLEEALSAPYLSGLRGAAKAERIAWIQESRGHRDIWMAEAPTYAPFALTHYDSDDGQELSDLTLNHDASIIVYVRGGTPNKEGVVPNPTSDPKPAKREVWALVKGEKQPRRLGEGIKPSISPDGRSVVFIKEGQFFISPLDRTAEAKQLFRARGTAAGAKWSPDGTRLAFTSVRGQTHSFIGVYDLKREKLTWMSPDFQRDTAPTWSPDGKELAYIRTPAEGAEPSLEHEPARPFSIWIADPETGAGRAVWNSPDQTARFAQSFVPVPLLWAGGDRLLFYWERDGWLRIYSLGVRGGEPTPLTPAGCEAEDAVLSNSGEEVIFTSNCSDIDRRHIWKVGIHGGTATQLTPAGSLQWSPAAVADGKLIAFLQATAVRPAQPGIMNSADGTARTVEGQATTRFPASALVEPRSLTFKAPDGTPLHAQLFIHPDFARGARHPAIIFLHGGPVRQMLLGWHYLGYYHHCYAMNQFLASRGYVVMALNYRAGIGYGRAYRRIPKDGWRGAAEYQDVVAAGRYLQRLPEVDPKRVGLWGGSHGGFLTALGLGRDSKLFSAGVDLHGVHDWAHFIDQWKLAPSMGPEREAALRTARASSPISAVSTWTSPVLFIHGDDDPTVQFAQTTDLIARLRARPQVHIETLAIPDEVHSFLRYESWLRAFRASAEFFDRMLKNAPSSQPQAASRGM